MTTNLTKTIMDKISQSLTEKFYYSTDLFRLIDDIFFELDSITNDQISIRHQLEEDVSAIEQAA